METHEFLFELGITVKSKISGFKGVITCRSEHLNGCDRYFVETTINKEGKLLKGYWLDEIELIKMRNKKIKTKHKEGKPLLTGGFPSKVK